ncbi:hypothetical protein Tco_1304665 [Tanacetum coccineum]
MLVIKRFSERKKVFRERKKTGKIPEKRYIFLPEIMQYLWTGFPTASWRRSQIYLGAARPIRGSPLEYALVFVFFGECWADNCLPMLHKTQYSSWASRMLLYIKDAKKIRKACDIKATNIVLQCSPQDIYNLVNHHEEAKHIWDRVKLLIEGSEISLQERESKLYDGGLVVPSFLSDDPIASLNKAMDFISITFTSRYPPTKNHLRTLSNPRNQTTIQDGTVTVQTS